MPEVVLQSLTNPQYNMHVHIPDSNNTSSENARGVRPHVSTTIVASTSQPSTHRAALPSPFRQYAGPVDGIAICDDADLAKMGHLYELYSFTKLPCLHGERTRHSAAPLPEELCLHAVYSDDDDNGDNASDEDDDDEMNEDDESKTPCVDGRDTQGIALAKVNSLSSAEVNATLHACLSVHTVASSSTTSSSFTTPLSDAYTARHNQSSLTTPTSSSISSSISSQVTMSSSERQEHKSTGSRFAFWHRVPSSLPTKVITERGKTLHVAYSARAQKGKSAKHGANVCEASELYESINGSSGGGFVIFADSLVNAKPRSAIAVVTRAYKQISGLHNSNDANNAGDGLNGLKLPDAKRYIREVLQGGRPLFRRRPSAVVYGSGWYIPQPT